MSKNYLYTTRDDLPILDFGQPILIGPSATGTLSITSSASTDLSVYPNIEIRCTNLNTSTNSMYLIPVFPSGTLPRRFIFEAVMTRFSDVSNKNVFFVVGTSNSSSLGFNGMAFSLRANVFATISNGIFSSSFNSWAPPGGIFIAGNYLTYIEKEFEFKTQTFATGSDVVFRGRDYNSTNEENSTFQHSVVYCSDSLFPWQSFPSGWNGQTFNKLFLGVVSDGVATWNVLFDSIRVKKHSMDWD
jgi:hypothetical protein